MNATGMPQENYRSASGAPHERYMCVTGRDTGSASVMQHVHYMKECYRRTTGVLLEYLMNATRLLQQ
jgi:hypothetical protein